MKNIRDLEYISLEGGGGKGSVYLGAILALEKLMYDEWKEERLLRYTNKDYTSMSASEALNQSLLQKSQPYCNGLFSILDYCDSNKNIKIKGIAGSSAGAITSFPLALGLNSSDIKSILAGYEFEKEFMPLGIHEGKYRMVGMNDKGKAKILHAEDKLKKLGESKIKEFNFDFVETELNGTLKKEVGRNLIKSIIRNQVVSFVIKILVSGILSIYEPINVFFAKLKKQGKISSIMSDGEIEKIEDTVELGPISVKFFEIWEKGFGFILSKFPSPVALSNSSVNIVLNTMKLLLPKKLGGFIPRDNITGAISNLIWDRGVYSGFEIREFFFRIILLSLSKDTHFRRKFIANKDMLQEFKIEAIDLENIEGCMVGFKLIKNEKNYKTLTKLSKTFAEDLTFEKFYKITRINLSCCVSNATYGQPMYFSSYFTPDFPVIEAMGASMSFPLAFKPLYCEANVIIDKENFGKEMNTEENTFVTYGKSKSGNIIKELFSQSDFIKYQNIVLSYIKKNCKLEFSLNSNLSFRSYLPYLRAIIHNEDFQEPFSYINSYTQQSESYSIKQIKELCYFFYNSAFKGLHVDGGATNNLPIAVHTYMTPENGILKYTNLQVLDIKEKVLSLKLDNTFPPDIKETVLKELMLDKNKKTLERLSNWQDKFATFTLVKQIKKGLKLKNALKRIKKDPIALEKILDMSEEVWVKICEEIIEDYKLTRKGFTPWNKQIIFLNAVMTPLQFGMDQGQIEAIEDNENIIPLYSFGLSVFDFDLTSKKLKPLVDVANEQSEKAVLNNFNS